MQRDAKAPRRSARLSAAAGVAPPSPAPPPPGQQQQQQQPAAAEGQGDGLILTDLVPDALALVYDCLPSKKDRRSLLHSCRAIHSLLQLRAKVRDGR